MKEKQRIYREVAVKKVMLIFLMAVLLNGCSNNNDVNARNLEADIEAKNEEIARLNETISELEGRIEYLRSLLGSTEKDIFDSRVQVGDMYYQYYSAGGKYLEDGIVLILEAYDENQDIIWIKPWEGIHISELDPYSPFIIRDDILYIVVSGDLYTINVNTGEVYWSVEEVGHSSVAPLVDEDGQIFTIGQYTPYITAIDSQGKIIWQESDNELNGAGDIKFDNDTLIVECLAGTFIYSKNGERLEDN
jgi:outer membrane protein assembly factor BamB